MRLGPHVGFRTMLPRGLLNVGVLKLWIRKYDSLQPSRRLAIEDPVAGLFENTRTLGSHAFGRLTQCLASGLSEVSSVKPIVVQVRRPLAPKDRCLVAAERKDQVIEDEKGYQGSNQCVFHRTVQKIKVGGCPHESTAVEARAVLISCACRPIAAETCEVPNPSLERLMMLFVLVTKQGRCDLLQSPHTLRL